MANDVHLKGHFSLAEMVSGHIEVWRGALTDCLMIKGADEDRLHIQQELQALDDVESALIVELQQEAAEGRESSLQAENSQLREMLAQKVIDTTQLRAFTAQDGRITARFEGAACELLAQALAKQLYESGAVNFIEMCFESPDYPDLGQMVVTLKRESGKSPSELRVEAEAQRDALLSRNEDLVAALQPFARYELVRAAGGGSRTVAGKLWSCSGSERDAAITIEDMQRAVTLVSEHTLNSPIDGGEPGAHPAAHE